MCRAATTSPSIEKTTSPASAVALAAQWGAPSLSCTPLAAALVPYPVLLVDLELDEARRLVAFEGAPDGHALRVRAPGRHVVEQRDLLVRQRFEGRWICDFEHARGERTGLVEDDAGHPRTRSRKSPTRTKMPARRNCVSTSS